MSTTKNPRFKALLAIVCLQLLPACAPILKSQKIDVEVPAAFQHRQAEADNSAELPWERFFSDPNLAGLIDTALQNNQEVKIAMQDIQVASNEVYARIGEYYPFVTLKGAAGIDKASQYSREESRETLNSEMNPSYLLRPEGETASASTSESKTGALPTVLPNFMAGIATSWELDVWKKLRNAKDVSVYEYMASMEGRKLIVTNLVAEIANTYYELLALDNKLNNLEQNISIQQEVLGIIRMLKQAARSNELAVKRFEAEVQKNQSEVFALKQQIAEAENRLNYLMGRRPQPIKRDSAQFGTLNPAAVTSGLPSQLLNNRPDIKRAEFELAAADLNVQVAKARFYPAFSMNAGIGYEAFNPAYLTRMPQSLTYSLSVDMTAPLINKNAITAEYQTANSRQIQAVYEYERLILNAYREVANQIASIDNLNQNYQLKDQQVETLTQSIDISRQLFKFARADYMEVLLTQRDAVEARMELIETKLSQLSAMVNLYKALGGGWRGKNTQPSTPAPTQSDLPNFRPDNGSDTFVPQLESKDGEWPNFYEMLVAPNPPTASPIPPPSSTQPSTKP